MRHYRAICAFRPLDDIYDEFRIPDIMKAHRSCMRGREFPGINAHKMVVWNIIDIKLITFS
ncbi:hypothetical protein AOA80_03605 [Methanomassiliicoccales archaeon RumEn M1]|nr:hypothetical protein AOA80_03605 [Methanomassiliicoccales archaeon RumEn M1]